MATINLSNKQRLTYAKNNQFIFLTILFIATWFCFFFSAMDLKDWWMENILVVMFCAIVILSQKICVFKHISSVYFSVSYIALYGARMAYTQNELGEFLKITFHLSRNPYDRIVHFSFGFLMIYTLCDYLVYNYKLLKRHLFLISNMIILSLATIFELIELGVAEFTDSATGETYVATQGDPWDAQNRHHTCCDRLYAVFWYTKNLYQKNYCPVTDLINLSTA